MVAAPTFSRQVCRGALQAAAGDHLQADHDQDQRPHVGKEAQTVGRDETGVREERNDANQDQNRRPQDAAVIAHLSAHGRERRTSSQTPSAISNTGQTTSGCSQPIKPMLSSSK